MHKDWQGWGICANPPTLNEKTPRNLILCGQVKEQVAQGEVRYARNVSVTYKWWTFGLPRSGLGPRGVR